MTPGLKKLLSLLAFFAPFIPPALGLMIPGGATGNVELGLESITLRTLPWTGSIAAIVLMFLHYPDAADGPKFAGALFILAAGAFLAFQLAPDFQLTASQAANPMYALLAEVRPDVAMRATQLAARNPEATLVAGAFGIVTAIAFAYALLYGPVLWAAGIACGGLIGWKVNDIMTND